MNAPRAAVRVAKPLAIGVAGLGALLASLLGMYAALICSPYLGAPAGLLILFVPLTTMFVMVAALKRWGWAWRVVLGVLLIAGSLLLMPRTMCGAEPQRRHGC